MPEDFRNIPLASYGRNFHLLLRFPSTRDPAAAWRSADTVGVIAFHNAVHGTSQRALFEDSAFIVFARGDRGIVAINKSAERQHPRIWTYGLRHGRYRCMIHGYDMQVQGDYFEFAIPHRQA
jgi:alpha-amylase